MTNLITERSPDGTLALLVDEYVRSDGTFDIAIGFDGAPWHIHPPQHIGGGAPAQQWARDLVADVVNNRMLIVTSCSDGSEVVSLAYPLEIEIDFKGRDELLEFRFWNGQVVSVEDLIDGKVSYVPLSASDLFVIDPKG